MKKRVFLFLFVLSILLSLCGCSGDQSASYFRVTFIDVGQGDSALIECDGYNMLIDAGTKASSESIISVLKDRTEPITHLDILAVSHLHEDHIGGMVDILEYLNKQKNGNKIELVISNSNRGEKKAATEFISKLDQMGNKITVPEAGSVYNLGSAKVEVIYNSAANDNDSLVLLITYQNATFLFTGDIEKEAHSDVAQKLREKNTHLKNKNNLIKMPHHGAYNSDRGLPANASDNSLATLVSAAWAKYFVISVGERNNYGHPDQGTLDIISQALRVHGYDEKEHFFRTDKHGNIVVTVAVNGRDLIVSPKKK